MAEIRALLQRCDPALLDPDQVLVLDSCRDPEQPDCAEAAGMVLHLTDHRRMQKVLGRQLFVLDSMMSLLEGLKSARQLMTQPCPPRPEGGARSRWKALKVDSRSGAEQTETLIRTLQDRITHITERRHTLTQLVAQLHNKKQQCDQLSESLLKAQNALQSCDEQLMRLRAESEAALGQLSEWRRLREQLQVFVSAGQEVMQLRLLSFSQSELCVELRPRPSSQLSSNEMEPVRLSVSWCRDDRFRLQVSGEAAGLLEEGMTGRRAELSAALLEVMHSYLGQFQLLSEIHHLRSRFAIDWRPLQRVVVFLQSAVQVCELQVEEGYPSRGRARLLTVRRDGQPVDTCGLQPPQCVSLTDWLVFLSSCPLL